MNVFTRIAAALAVAKQKAAAFTTLREPPTDGWWRAHSAPAAKRAKRALNRTIGHRQAKRVRMAHPRSAA